MIILIICIPNLAGVFLMRRKFHSCPSLSRCQTSITNSHGMLKSIQRCLFQQYRLPMVMEKSRLFSNPERLPCSDYHWHLKSKKKDFIQRKSKQLLRRLLTFCILSTLLPWYSMLASWFTGK